ncbi:MAG: DUF1566 domain-containing protein [Bdellovibrionales bacterium]
MSEDNAREGWNDMGRRMRFIRNAIVLTFVCFLYVVTPAHARTTASYGQNAVGTSCNNVAKAADFDAIAQCNSGTGAGTMQTAPIIVGTVTAPPYSNTTCDSSKAGMIQWTGTAFQGCDGSNWIDFAGSGSSSTCTPNAFSFTDQTEVTLDTAITSNIVTLGDDPFTCVSIISCPSCTALYKNGAAVSTAGTAFLYGDSISVALQSASSSETTMSVEITAGTHSTTWSVTTGDICDAESPPIGAVCVDGSIYAGLSPDGNVKMFTTPCDQIQTGTQGACSGTRPTYRFAPSTSFFRGVVSLTDGDGNTETLRYYENQAAIACYNLTAHGHSDWYLPARDELDVLVDNYATIGGFANNYYWSSSEIDAGTAYVQSAFTGTQGPASKLSTSIYTRCVRHN